MAFIALTLTSCSTTVTRNHAHTAAIKSSPNTNNSAPAKNSTSSTGISPVSSNRFPTGGSALSSPSMTFGIIPPQLPSPSMVPKMLNYITSLADGHRFIVHLYTSWAEYPTTLPSLRNEISYYAAKGIQVDLALRYVPPHGQDGNIKGFAAYVATMVRDFAHQHNLTMIQVTNEPNSPFNQEASDGGYIHPRTALVDGIEAGTEAKDATGSHVALGFNWFYSFGQAADKLWWSGLGKLGGSKFASDVNWVGMDIYPGTYVPASITTSTAASVVAASLGYLRNQLLPLAGINSSVPIGFSEIGWATKPPSRPYSEQATLLTAFVKGACSVQSTYNVRFLQWFKMADNTKYNPASPLATGIMTSTLEPKPAYNSYKTAVSQGCNG